MRRSINIHDLLLFKTSSSSAIQQRRQSVSTTANSTHIPSKSLHIQSNSISNIRSRSSSPALSSPSPSSPLLPPSNSSSSQALQHQLPLPSNATMGSNDRSGDYQLIIDSEPDGGSLPPPSSSPLPPRSPSFSIANTLGGGQANQDIMSLTWILNHPGLPVVCYCAASIMMTVINKVRSLVLSPFQRTPEEQS